MCVAMPGKVVSVDGTLATVDFNGNVIRAQAGLVDVRPGDFVLVHAGCILQKMTQSDSDALSDLLREMEAL